MGRYEFKLVVSGVELSEEVQKQIGQAVRKAGAGAIAHAIPNAHPISSIPLDLEHLWIGRPSPEILAAANEIVNHVPSNPVSQRTVLGEGEAGINVGGA